MSTRSPASSLDPAIRQLAVRRTEMVTEAARLDGLIDVYVLHVKPQEVRPAAVPIEHYGMLDSQACGCAICSEWLQRREELVDALKLMPKGHKWSLCACDTCRFIAVTHTGFLAAVNRRDLLIETAYHARHSTKYGAQVMHWLAGEMERTRQNIKWSAQELSRQPMSHWLRKCEAVVGPQVSGVVFSL